MAYSDIVSGLRADSASAEQSLSQGFEAAMAELIDVLPMWKEVESKMLLDPAKRANLAASPIRAGINDLMNSMIDYGQRTGGTFGSAGMKSMVSSLFKTMTPLASDAVKGTIEDQKWIGGQKTGAVERLGNLKSGLQERRGVAIGDLRERTGTSVANLYSKEAGEQFTAAEAQKRLDWEKEKTALELRNSLDIESMKKAYSAIGMSPSTATQMASQRPYGTGGAGGGQTLKELTDAYALMTTQGLTSTYPEGFPNVKSDTRIGANLKLAIENAAKNYGGGR